MQSKDGQRKGPPGVEAIVNLRSRLLVLEGLELHLFDHVDWVNSRLIGYRFKQRQQQGSIEVWAKLGRRVV